MNEDEGLQEKVKGPLLIVSYDPATGGFGHRIIGDMPGGALCGYLDIIKLMFQLQLLQQNQQQALAEASKKVQVAGGNTLFRGHFPGG